MSFVTMRRNERVKAARPASQAKLSRGSMNQSVIIMKQERVSRIK